MNNVLALFVSIVMAANAYGLSLDEARKQQLVGEKRSGYVGVVEGRASTDVQSLVDEINRKRRAAYEAIAKKNGAPLEAVEQTGAKEAFAKSPAGTFVEGPNGQWIRK